MSSQLSGGRKNLSTTHNLQNVTSDYLYVEMAHYTDDDTIVLICITNYDDFKVHEFKLEKLNEPIW